MIREYKRAWHMYCSNQTVIDSRTIWAIFRKCTQLHAFFPNPLGRKDKPKHFRIALHRRSCKMISITKKRAVELVLTVLAVFLFVVPDRQVFAFTQSDLVSGGSIWLETTIAVALVFVSAMAFSLQIARGYFIRILNKFTLRLGADIWWLAYVLIRDALIFMSFVMGLLVFFPGTFLDYPIAVPFMPLSVVFFGIALVTKLYVDADDNRNAFRVVTVLVFIGTLLWISGTIFVTETPLVLSTLPPGVSATSGIWYTMYSTFSSTGNLGLAMESFQACFAILGVIAIFGFAHPILHSRLPKLKKVVTATTAVPTPATPVARAVPTTHSNEPSSPASLGRSSSTDDMRHYGDLGIEKDRRSAEYIG